MMKGPAPLTDLSIGEDCEIADDQSSVLDQLIKSERVMEVVNAIEELDSARDRALLRMFLFELRSPVEIATRLDCPVSRVYVIKTRAIKRLQLLLEGVTSDVDASGR
jgi:RNA polymerase sigma factor (sigma-70 family)